ncbi:hypothetical protein L6452_08289 [Arctium lappa]|uniref:Uncharacterized protein n=1 Tax=Arctium lappa TaxID=4217 RepID=A0ACB9DHP3_ARCLA|nr:hypothetical protein L6452_08289 [Arctium lappa]
MWKIQKQERLRGVLNLVFRVSAAAALIVISSLHYKSISCANPEDNSSWTRNRRFRLGARVVDNCEGIIFTRDPVVYVPRMSDGGNWKEYCDGDEKLEEWWPACGDCNTVVDDEGERPETWLWRLTVRN